jgi:small subunit ribosomal protein S16
VAVKIKLKRMGKIRAPYYRIVVADARTKRDGRAIEEIGRYHPTEEPSLIQVDSERAQYWLSVGAQPTEAVAVLLKVTGDWQRFKGLPGAEGTLKTAAPRPDKKAVFEKVAREAMDEPKEGATTTRGRAAKSAPRSSAAPAAAEPAAPAAAEPAAAEPAAEASETEATAQPDPTGASTEGAAGDEA